MLPNITYYACLIQTKLMLKNNNNISGSETLEHYKIINYIIDEDLEGKIELLMTLHS